MTVTVGSGLGGFSAIVAQPTYGATFVTPTRALAIKNNKATHDPHIVQGGPYLAAGRMVDIGSAHEQMYLDAKGTMSGDVMNIGHALLLATAMGSSGVLTQSGTTSAWELGGPGGIVLGAPDKNNEPVAKSGCCFDMQIAVPTTDGTLNPFNYHSCMIPKGEWVFDRTGLVTFSYDWDAQFLETSTALITPTFPGGPVPFSMATATSLFKAGAFGAEANIDGIRKATITIEHKLATDRIYLGNEHKDVPVSNERIDITVALEADYTVAAKVLFETFLKNEPESIICMSVGNAIGTSGKKDTFSMGVTNAFLQTGGEPTLDGPDLVKNTLTFKGTLDAAADASVKASLITADTTF